LSSAPEYGAYGCDGAMAEVRAEADGARVIAGLLDYPSWARALFLRVILIGTAQACPFKVMH
jgi:hypothetical protein